MRSMSRSEIGIAGGGQDNSTIVVVALRRFGSVAVDKARRARNNWVFPKVLMIKPSSFDGRDQALLALTKGVLTETYSSNLANTR